MSTTNTNGFWHSDRQINWILVISALSLLILLLIRFYPVPPPPPDTDPCWNPEEFYTLPAIQAEWQVALCRTDNCSINEFVCFDSCRTNIKVLPSYIALQERHKEIAYVFAKNCRERSLDVCSMILAFPWLADFIWYIIIGDPTEDCDMNNCYTHVMLPALYNSPAEFRMVSDSVINSIVLQTPSLSYNDTTKIFSNTIDGKSYWATVFEDVPVDTTLLLIVNGDTIRLWLKG
ncbi:MAG: hypothetical protein KA479_03790 [Saprospiraceae bacterium]|nr:hypothetical protein [Saprospiraceae bacterium]